MWNLFSLIDPVTCTRLEVNELCRFEPQVDLLLCAFHGVTAVNYVSVRGDKRVIPGKNMLSAP